MAFTHTTKDRSIIIRIESTRLDAALAPDFKDYSNSVITENVDLIVIDLSNIVFIDSSGLGSIVGLFKGLGGLTTLKLAGLNPPVKNLLKLTRMDRILNCFDNVEEALN